MSKIENRIIINSRIIVNYNIYMNKTNIHYLKLKYEFAIA